jgi:hypothetical protein
MTDLNKRGGSNNNGGELLADLAEQMLQALGVSDRDLENRMVDNAVHVARAKGEDIDLVNLRSKYRNSLKNRKNKPMTMRI